MMIFFSALCLATLFVETFAPLCVQEERESDDFRFQRSDGCFWIEWSNWSGCSGGIQSRWRTKEDRVNLCRCDYQDQTRSCSIVIHQPSECLSH